MRFIRQIDETLPPWSNDADLNRRYLAIVWRERNEMFIGRAVWVYVAVIGWVAFTISLMW